MNGRALLDDGDGHIRKKDKDHDDHYHSSLWCQLVKRDFTDDELRQHEELVRLSSHQNQNQIQKKGSVHVGTLEQSGGREMRQYQSLYSEFHFVGLERVPNPGDHFGEDEPREIFKVLFAVANYRLNLAVTTLLKDREFHLSTHYTPTIGVDFLLMHFKSKRVEVRPHLTMQLWMVSPGPERFRSIPAAYYRATQAMVLVLDPLHSKLDRYNHDNTLEKVLERLRHMETDLNMSPPKACKGVFIVAVGTWPSDTPVSKDQFLEQCAQAFTLVPIEHYEITQENALTVGDHLVRRMLRLQRAALKEDGPQKPYQPPSPPSSTSSSSWLGCVIS